MKFSELWLREWVNPSNSRGESLSSEQLSDQITMAGLEVESINKVAGDFHGVIIGYVVKCSPHPNTNKLRVTKIDIGSDNFLDIVCGAANCRQGLKVAVATVGSVLSMGDEIKITKLCGITSEGILCSASELLLLEKQEGIIELPVTAPIGMDIRDFLNLNDKIIEINVTPNRADCLSIIGIARDLAAIYKLPLIEPNIIPVTATLKEKLPITVLEEEACPRYLGLIIKSINSSAIIPQWMQNKLFHSGIRSINPIVDITNYVMLELGQPIHAFDLDKIDSEIIVRFAVQGETLLLFDGSEAILNTDTLVISDRKKVLAIAGIFGGLYSGISKQTSSVFLECAFFNPLYIIGRARHYGLHTHASHRYERGVDPELQYKALKRAVSLLTDICGGEVSTVIDVTNSNKLPKPVSITLRYKKLNHLLGYTMIKDHVHGILNRLGCKVTEQENSCQILAPSWRFDLQIEEDLIEEIARINGYHTIPNQPIYSSLRIRKYNERDALLKRVKILLVDLGYHEAITYSFVDPKIQILLHPDQKALALQKPISKNMSVMRLSLLTGLLTTILYNQNRQQTRLRLFESGLRFIPDNSAELNVRQDFMLAGVITGNSYREHWDICSKSVDFFDLKGDLEEILELTGRLSDIKFCYESNFYSFLHPGQSAVINLSGKSIGFIGVIHPALEAKLGLKSHTIVFELQWNKLENYIKNNIVDVSRFPENRRDIDIVVSDNIPVADILAECKKVSLNQIVDVNLFDVYSGKGVADGHKSLTISLILQDTVRTLSEDEISDIIEKCIVVLKEKFQAFLRY